MIDRRTLLQNLKLIFQDIAPVNLGWRVGEKKNEISIRIVEERRTQISEYHKETDVVLEVRIVYYFENKDIDNAIEDNRILMIQKLMTNKINLLNAGFYLQDSIRVLAEATDDNSGFVALEVLFAYKDDLY